MWRMDWTLTGAVAGVAIVATAVGYEFYVFTRSDPEPAKEYHATAVLIPASKRPVLTTPAIANVPGLEINATQVSPTAGSRQSPSRTEAPLSDGSRPPDQPPPANYGNSAHNKVKPQPKVNSDSWMVRTTAKASYFNLGGHVDKNGVVDSLASSYLRDALKKHKNYAKLPAQIQVYIDAPKVNLAKIAGYRALLGVSDKEMEEEQGVRFVLIANSRGIEINPTVADVDIPPIDLSSMEFDLRRRMQLGLVP